MGKKQQELVQAALLLLFDDLVIDVDSLDEELPQNSAEHFEGYRIEFLEGFIERREHPRITMDDAKLASAFDKFLAATGRGTLEIIYDDNGVPIDVKPSLGDQLTKECWEKQCQMHRGRKDAYGEHLGVDSWRNK